MEDLIKLLDYEVERISKIVNHHGKEHPHTKEQYHYTLGILTGMLLCKAIDEKTYNQYGKVIEETMS